MEIVQDINGTNSPSAQLILSTATPTTTETNNNDNINNNNSITVDTQLIHQQQHLHPLYATAAAATILQQNDSNSIITATAISPSATTTTNFVAIPLSERPPIICISQQQQNGNNHHENYSNTSLTRSTSCLVRLRQSCLNFFTKIMGSNNPSEADRFEYYDYLSYCGRPINIHSHYFGQINKRYLSTI